MILVILQTIAVQITVGDVGVNEMQQETGFHHFGLVYVATVLGSEMVFRCSPAASLPVMGGDTGRFRRNNRIYLMAIRRFQFWPSIVWNHISKISDDKIR